MSSFLNSPPGDSSTRPTASIPRILGNLTSGEWPLARVSLKCANDCYKWLGYWCQLLEYEKVINDSDWMNDWKTLDWMFWTSQKSIAREAEITYCLVYISDRFRPTALIRMRTWPICGFGFGHCCILRTSGPPMACITAAFMVWDAMIVVLRSFGVDVIVGRTVRRVFLKVRKMNSNYEGML